MTLPVYNSKYCSDLNEGEELHQLYRKNIKKMVAPLVGLESELLNEDGGNQ
jgi:hypothetical protein